MNKEELRELLDTFEAAYFELHLYIKRSDKREYERWKAGGYLVDDNVVSMYPTLPHIIQKLIDDMPDESDEQE